MGGNSLFEGKAVLFLSGPFGEGLEDALKQQVFVYKKRGDSEKHLIDLV